MSIALEARVTTLEQERNSALLAVDLLAQRVNKLEAQLEILVELSKPRERKPKDVV